jgi:hypothetical protein
MDGYSWTVSDAQWDLTDYCRRLSMNRLIDADALDAKAQKLWERNEITNGEWLLIRQLLSEQPTIDAVPLDGSFLKMSKGGYVIYQRKWLYEHLEQEFNILKSASGKPTIDAEPVRHAKLLNAHPYGECSNCGYLIDIREEFNYCPNCGAYMRGESNE